MVLIRPCSTYFDEHQLLNCLIDVSQTPEVMTYYPYSPVPMSPQNAIWDSTSNQPREPDSKTANSTVPQQPDDVPARLGLKATALSWVQTALAFRILGQAKGVKS